MSSKYIDICKEYTQWSLTQDIQYLFKNLNDHSRYESFNILERWRIAMANENKCLYNAWMTIYDVNNVNASQNTVKMCQEFKDKSIPNSIALIKSTLEYVERYADEYSKNPKSCEGYEPIWENKTSIVTFGRFFIPYDDVHFRNIGARLNSKELFNDYKLKWLRMAIRYESLAPGGQQWSLPESFGIFLYEKFNVCNIGFASPFNFQLRNIHVESESKKLKPLFYSLFPDTDAFIGSRGNFFNQENGHMSRIDGNWFLNPPFTPCILEKTANKLMNEFAYAMENNLALEVHYLMPAWKDSAWYKTFSSSKWLKWEVSLPKNTYKFEVSGTRHDKKTITAKVNCIYMLFSTRSITTPECDAMKDQILRNLRFL